MKTYVDSIKPVEINRARRKDARDKANPKEYTAYRSLAGEIVWAGNGALPHAAFVGSFMQQNAPTLRVEDITEAKKNAQRNEGS